MIGAKNQGLIALLLPDLVKTDKYIDDDTTVVGLVRLTVYEQIRNKILDFLVKCLQNMEI